MIITQLLIEYHQLPKKTEAPVPPSHPIFDHFGIDTYGDFGIPDFKQPPSG
jgi:hypothetical protein